MFDHKNELLISITLIIISLSLVISCVRSSSSYPSTMPYDFNFISGIRDNSFVIDTYKNTLTKALDWEKDTIISFEFPKKEKEKIFQILKDIDIYRYPENFAPTSSIIIYPSFSYQFKFTLNGIDYGINWKEHTDSENRDAKNLRKLFREILRFIEIDDRVKNLPESKRHYL